MGALQSSVPSERQTARAGTRTSKKRWPRWRGLMPLLQAPNACVASAPVARNAGSSGARLRAVRAQIVAAYRYRSPTLISRVKSPASVHAPASIVEAEDPGSVSPLFPQLYVRQTAYGPWGGTKK